MPSTEQDFIKLEQQLPIQKPIFEPSNEQIKYTWIGHSTAVISIGKKANILIDPVFSERSSPVTFAGPKRFRNPACQIEDLPKIDLVFVSHDHHDHLNPSSLQKIENLHQPYFIAGLQSADVFPQNCKMVQMDWMDEKVLKINKQNFKLTFVPVCHWSRRGLTDQGKRLWGGLILETPNNKRIFYPGDTGYCGVFKQIGDKYGPFDLCILPIGAYQPRDLLKAQHFNPDDSVKVHLQLKSKKSVGVHWGTFPLGMEHYLAARIDLKKAKQKYGIPDDEFITVNHGGSFTVNDRKI